MSKILLIDDDEDMLAMTTRWLEKAGYEVTKASSGKAALELLEGMTPDLILLDYAMPEMDGKAVLKELRQSDKNKNIPVLYRTGMDDNAIETDEASPRPDGIVPKSEGKNFLLKSITGILG